jgi:hypothetical protein
VAAPQLNDNSPRYGRHRGMVQSCLQLACCTAGIVHALSSAASACCWTWGYASAHTCPHCIPLLQGCPKTACGRPTTRSCCWHPRLLPAEEGPWTSPPCLSPWPPRHAMLTCSGQWQPPRRQALPSAFENGSVPPMEFHSHCGCRSVQCRVLWVVRGYIAGRGSLGVAGAWQK